MQIFMDSADFKQIENWLAQGVVDGVTTNPSIMLNDGVTDLEEGARRLANLLGDKPLSVEVTSNDHGTMLEQARLFATWARNMVIKIPIINEFGESCGDGDRQRGSSLPTMRHAWPHELELQKRRPLYPEM